MRWAKRGDTIETVRVIEHGMSAGKRLRVKLPLDKSDRAARACATANDLIASGHWRVVEAQPNSEALSDDGSPTPQKADN